MYSTVTSSQQRSQAMALASSSSASGSSATTGSRKRGAKTAGRAKRSNQEANMHESLVSQISSCVLVNYACRLLYYLIYSCKETEKYYSYLCWDTRVELCSVKNKCMNFPERVVLTPRPHPDLLAYLFAGVYGFFAFNYQSVPLNIFCRRFAREFFIHFFAGKCHAKPILGVRKFIHIDYQSEFVYLIGFYCIKRQTML